MIAVDLNGAGICAVEGRAGKNGVNVVRAEEVALPGGTEENGNILNEVAFAMALQKLRVNMGFRSRTVAMTIGSSAVLSRKLELPTARPREFGRMVANEMMQVVGDAADFVYEYALSGEQPGGGQSVSVWAYAMPNSMADSYYNIFRNLRYRPAALDIHGNCMEKLLAGSQVNGADIHAKPVLFVQIEADGLEIHLFSKGRREFSHITPVSAEKLLVALGSFATGADQKSRSLPEYDLGADSVRKDAVVTEISHRYVGSIADEIVKMVQFQLRRNSLDPVAQIFLYGRLSQIKGIEQALSAVTGIRTDVVRSVSRVHAKMPVAPYLNAIGALIRL